MRAVRQGSRCTRCTWLLSSKIRNLRALKQLWRVRRSAVRRRKCCLCHSEILIYKVEPASVARANRRMKDAEKQAIADEAAKADWKQIQYNTKVLKEKTRAEKKEKAALRREEVAQRRAQEAREKAANAAEKARLKALKDAQKASCRRPSAVVNLNCVTNRVAQGPRYKLSYDARTTRQYTLFLIFYTCNPRTQPCGRHLL